MKTFGTALFLGISLGTGLAPAWGQAAASGSELPLAVAALHEQYTASFASHPQLYNGPEYVDYAKRYHARTGHQFFSSPDKQPGSVYYNDHAFTDLRLAYDVVLDQVVLGHPSSPLTLRLVNENVRRFYLNYNYFTRLVADSASGGVIRTGFYEVLVDSGAVQVLAKRAKRLREHLQQQAVDVEFTPADRLFIRKDGTYYAIKRKSHALRLFSDNDKAMQKYIQEQKLSFKKEQFERSVVQLARYYAGLAQPQ